MVKWEYIKLEWHGRFPAHAGYAEPSSSQWRVEETGQTWPGADLMGALTELGQQGWELASMAVYPSGGEFAILKRVAQA